MFLKWKVAFYSSKDTRWDFEAVFKLLDVKAKIRHVLADHNIATPIYGKSHENYNNVVIND